MTRVTGVFVCAPSRAVAGQGVRCWTLISRQYLEVEAQPGAALACFLGTRDGSPSVDFGTAMRTSATGAASSPQPLPVALRSARAWWHTLSWRPRVRLGVRVGFGLRLVPPLFILAALNNSVNYEASGRGFSLNVRSRWHWFQLQGCAPSADAKDPRTKGSRRKVRVSFSAVRARGR